MALVLGLGDQVALVLGLGDQVALVLGLGDQVALVLGLGHPEALAFALVDPMDPAPLVLVVVVGPSVVVALVQLVLTVQSPVAVAPILASSLKMDHHPQTAVFLAFFFEVLESLEPVLLIPCS